MPSRKWQNVNGWRLSPKNRFGLNSPKPLPAWPIKRPSNLAKSSGDTRRSP